MATRDMSSDQFEKALKKYGFRHTGFMGYVQLPGKFSHIHVCRFNGGDKRRGQLAYLLCELSKAENELLTGD